jgi:predicted nucleotidyltransferase
MPTALELQKEGWKPYIIAAKKRKPQKEATSKEKRLKEELIGRIRNAATTLKSKFGAKRVILFGSLAHAGWFVEDSDVDLVVEGVPSEKYWQAWKFLEESISDRPVDLIDIETAGESLKRAIDRYGVEL